MGYTRGAGRKFSAGRVSTRTVGVEYTFPAFCSVCGDAFSPETERVGVVHYPVGRVEAWCLPCWACLLLHAKLGLTDCQHPESAA